MSIRVRESARPKAMSASIAPVGQSKICRCAVVEDPSGAGEFRRLLKECTEI
ncbi:hypothetical protein NXT3_CH01991 [Sinorhizobium fredii]|uniref:Uncharacterized protein n=1 Tax=Rhizobium fredii TaxID=380 RepID=A0A2L0H4Z8_RHIFR|nr:hypothetical protein NXT3_CH01991 [Sinorhizobium fredii]